MTVRIALEMKRQMEVRQRVGGRQAGLPVVASAAYGCVCGKSGEALVAKVLG